MRFDRKYVISALAYALAGMALGMFMAASKDHSQHVVHAHILLVGFVGSFIYGVIHRLWLEHDAGVVATLQFGLHHAGAIAMFAGLSLLYGNVYPESQLGPVLGLASLAVLVAALLMLYMVARSGTGKS